MENVKQMEEKFRALLQEQDSYREALSLVQWDLRTKIPTKGTDQRAEVIGLLSQKIHQIKTSDEMKECIDQLKNQTGDAILQRAVEVCEEEYQRSSLIPDEEHRAYITLQSKSESIWQQARDEDNFELLQPYLEELVAYNKKFATYWGATTNKYDQLLDLFEPGVTTALLDQVFEQVRDGLTDLVQQISQADHQPDSHILTHYFPKEAQEKFSLDVLHRMGYDFQSGRLDETIHPFAIGINPNDVRITTRYDEQDFRMAVFGTIHEGGHALYEQNIDNALAQTPLATGTSMGIHESQSLFWENFVGRSKSFWKVLMEDFKSVAPEAFQQIDFEDFYGAVNEVKPSYIRIEADELTYCLHIMVRYELEKALIDGDLAVKDLPEAWNDKMEAYLGIRPSTNKQGVLQDIHWSGGDFGYFPSYALGYMYAAQLHHQMQQEMDVEAVIESGDFSPITSWLTEHIHQYGKVKKPLELIKEVTGSSLNASYLVTYLTNKYKAIYNL
ncbi:carboxypeptidase 1 [Paraliobacillus ryukyuensis]|uniref:Metal-dependent carboxypeptidase n=1 Tax=Paraliobacillus ryukyuensis TaxID=200904 RepID=A0A366EGR4_9BACI|nr:carboxypeptidase M32 [Paraliobacillus ryukyuensis]RBP01574.1 carboxypeptidase Taq [Paraliobacillus ryukyuensis]